MSTPPATLASRPLYHTIAPLLARFTDPGVPDAVRLTALLAEQVPALRAPGGALHFSPEPPGPAGYEAHIHAHGAVPTRPGDWHDFFNALAWCVWPRTKLRFNQLHEALRRQRIAQGLAGRGPARDGLTQLDECGVVVAGVDAGLLSLLAEQEWEAAFWAHRARLVAGTRYFVLGHASWDQLRAPFVGLCAKAVYREVDAAWLARPLAWQQADTDAWLAEQVGALLPGLTPRAWRPLPLLGIPGVVADNASCDYYRDTRQFRPRRTVR